MALTRRLLQRTEPTGLGLARGAPGTQQHWPGSWGLSWQAQDLHRGVWHISRPHTGSAHCAWQPLPDPPKGVDSWASQPTQSWASDMKCNSARGSLSSPRSPIKSLPLFLHAHCSPHPHPDARTLLEMPLTQALGPAPQPGQPTSCAGPSRLPHGTTTSPQRALPQVQITLRGSPPHLYHVSPAEPTDPRPPALPTLQSPQNSSSRYPPHFPHQCPGTP